MEGVELSLCSSALWLQGYNSLLDEEAEQHRKLKCGGF